MKQTRRIHPLIIFTFTIQILQHISEAFVGLHHPRSNVGEWQTASSSSVQLTNQLFVTNQNSKNDGLKNSFTISMSSEDDMEDQFSVIEERPRSSATLTVTKEQSAVDLKSDQNRSSKKATNLLEGRWELLHGNYILRPPMNSSSRSTSYDATAPKVLIHFLGGAFIGASPHNAYRYMLEKLSERGYIIVATPYQLTFDHLKTCDEIISKFERCAPSLAMQYGAIPVVGVGHSCGALLQVLITSLFPDTPRAANILMSYNNKSVKDAVPVFDEIISPLSATLASSASNTTKVGEDEESWSPPSIIEAMALGLRLVKSSTEGDNLPSDELINEISTKMFPTSTPFSKISLPQNARESVAPLISPTASTLSDAGVLPILNQLIEVTEQIPSLLQEVADGVKDFNPSPEAVGTVAKKAYRARTTLLVKFENDSIDETDDLGTILAEAERIMRMKRPMVSMGIKSLALPGNHATPILAPPLAVASKAEDILGSDVKEKLLYKEADDVVESVSEWLEGLIE